MPTPNNFYEELKKYFETTPKSKIHEDWNKTVEFDKVGVTFDSLFKKEVISSSETMFYRKSEKGFFGFIQEISGVASQGKTLDELKENLLDAIKSMQNNSCQHISYKVSDSQWKRCNSCGTI